MEAIITENANLPEKTIETITEEINFYKQTAGMAICEIGKRLIEAKEKLNHGEWQKWLSEKVEFSEVSAQRFMRIAKEYKNPSTVTVLGLSKALILLSLPEEKRDNFLQEKHDVNGSEKTVEDMSKRELEKVIKELNSEKEKNDKAKNDIDALTSKIKKLEKTLEESENELEILKQAPIEVNCEITDEQKEEILSEEKEKQKEKEDKLQSEIEALKKDKETAKEKLAKLKKELEDEKNNSESTISTQKAQIEALSKKLEVNTSTALSEFKVHFDVAKNEINKMLEIAVKSDDKKLLDILNAFLTQVKEKVCE